MSSKTQFDEIEKINAKLPTVQIVTVYIERGCIYMDAIYPDAVHLDALYLDAFRMNAIFLGAFYQDAIDSDVIYQDGILLGQGPFRPLDQCTLLIQDLLDGFFPSVGFSLKS